MTNRRAPAGGKSAPRRRRVKFPAISEEMKEWSAMLGAELSSWAHISTKPMFGFLSFYRQDTIFAALPQTRGFGSASSMILKFNPMAPELLKRAQADERMDTSTGVPGKGWSSFEMRSPDDFGDALWWLGQAYQAAGR